LVAQTPYFDVRNVIRRVICPVRLTVCNSTAR
jgi:hypothetical protein